MLPRFLILIALWACASAQAERTLDYSQQCLVVTTDSWASPSGNLTKFARIGTKSAWRPVGSTVGVRVGRGGLAWGRGLTNTSDLVGPIKKEGDDKAPAGVFRLSNVFGWKKNTKMPFIEITPHVICVDDSSSPHYNRVFNELDVAGLDWRHAEIFSLISAYRMGIVVEHNAPPKPGAGSCIFLHIWESPTTSTSGCTAMSERELRRIIQWLDPAKHPLLVQLPRPAYDKLKSKWRLP